VELSADGRERHVDDREVELDYEQAQAADRQNSDPPAARERAQAAIVAARAAAES